MLRHYIITLLLFTLFIGDAKAQSQNNKHQLIRVLIVDGFSNHDWKQTTAVIKRLLEESGLFTVAVSTTPSTVADSNWNNWLPDFKQYQVVIQNTNNIQNKALQWPSVVQRRLEDYVRSGGGLYVLHSANNAFETWPEYNRMIGLGWRSKETGYAIQIDSNRQLVRVPPGEGKGTFHGARKTYLINILTKHPINKDFPAQWLTPDIELYQYARGPAENVTVLSYAIDSATSINWPVEWIVAYGKGRVYASSMGHLWKDEIYPISYRCIGFQTTLIRATEWLATGKVTYPVPTTFPSKDHISVRDEIR